ncbi:MAG: bifunctional DNA-formamidopyrimidine glycosylase/DNA-(apurinic or apyrimidinic site) lyase [Chloroflexota bacterium]|nr:bifunctional DNA-formamidopyrimidine glycosylase/DNA-(apurinic or apyrimidinic site) lyase [Chloroflexota bacterium]
MPELPEVETIRRLSETHLVGHTVRHVVVTLPKLFRNSTLPDAEMLTGRTLIAVTRRGKILDLAFADELHLLIHFKLAGQWAIVLPDGERHVAGHPVPKPDGDLPHKSTHASISFDDGRMAWYSDIRQFGWFNLVLADDVPGVMDGLMLGPEATDPIDVARLESLFSRRSVPVKAVLLDQKVVAGLGNIYADEALFAAGVHPSRPAMSLSTQEIARLAEAIPPILAEGIRQGGATIIHGKAYPDNDFPAVHGREGEPCIKCGSDILKTRVAGRGTYLCPICQTIQ